ncbi:MAG: methylated-DNA--[protein]-cysteine S-methyltransferase [Fimbriiglobus sp.]|nr:methylated-DNA--[protein]-cysteine S-methyltransferase [Fimbriiglobus sp.]
MPAAYYHLLPSPLGELLLASDGEFLTGVQMDAAPDPAAIADPKPFAEAVRQLKAYFAGELTRFDLPCRQHGTEFQQRVWGELVHIPFGEQVTYRQVAERLRQPTAARAVGSANGRNRLGIVVPCHRVVAAGGALGGYDWGLWRKEWLLAHERRA